VIVAEATKSKIEIQSVTVSRVRTTSEAFSVYEAQCEDRFLVVKQFTGPVERGQRWVVAGRSEIDQRWLEKSGRTTRQFVAQFATLGIPRTYLELDGMLSSGLLDHWDMHNAAQVMGGLSEWEALQRCVNRTQDLETLRGVTQPMIDSLRQALDRAESLAGVYAQLAEWGVTGKLSDKLVKYLGFNTVARLEDDPYQLVLEIDGYGWKSAEGIGQNQGIALDDPRRIAAGTAVAIHERTWQAGDTWLTEQEAAAAGAELLGCHHWLVYDQLEQCYANKTVTLDSGCLYPTPLHRAEETIAAQVAMRLEPCTMERYPMLDHMDIGIGISAEQCVAVMMALQNGISLLTGGPGVGKTTTLKELVRVARDMGLGVTCMAPTGKAAARMTEATGWPATTIHSRLKIVPGVLDLDSDFEAVTGLVIVDEVSMLDTSLAAQLLTRLSPSAQLLLVGDPDQLPSVGPGAVLRDLISANCIPRVHLDKVYRNDAGVAVNAARIRAGESIVELGDVRLIACPDAASTQYTVQELLAEITGAGMTHLSDPGEHARPATDVLVLTPTNDKPAGRHALNALLQPLLNNAEPGSGITQSLYTPKDPDGNATKRTEELRLGDRVMVVKNDSGLGVFNGQVGQITRVALPKALTATIDGRDVLFRGPDVRLLTLAYAITGHKSQGSEAPVVIVVAQPTRVLSREWAYTCMTRARERCYFVGDLNALQQCLSIQRAAERRTGLVSRIAAHQAGEWQAV
jgi:exodeoxyribonuclease V alpha subunit